MAIVLSLHEVQKALRGQIGMSLELDKICSSMSKGLVPEHWSKQSYPSLKPLAGYIADLGRRIGFFR